MACRDTGLLVLMTVGCALCGVSCQKGEGMKLAIEKATYGKLPDGRSVDIYTLTNDKGMRVKLTNYGAITVGVEVPDRAGKLADVTLGYDTLEGWLTNTS